MKEGIWAIWLQTQYNHVTIFPNTGNWPTQQIHDHVYQLTVIIINWEKLKQVHLRCTTFLGEREKFHDLTWLELN